jgi:hypothetical protein
MTKELLDPSLGKIVSVITYDGTDFHLIRADAAGHLQVDTLSSALPTGAATSANQLTEITALQLIDDLRNALASVATDSLKTDDDALQTLVSAIALDGAGHPQVDVLTSALPTGAATSANQLTEITALQLIDDLRNALASVATDSLNVRDTTLEDLVRIYQRGKIKSLFTETVPGAGDAGNIVLVGTAVPPSRILVVTWASIKLASGSAAAGCLYAYVSAMYHEIVSRILFGPGSSFESMNDILIPPGDSLRAIFFGVGAGTACQLCYGGYYIETA